MGMYYKYNLNTSSNTYHEQAFDDITNDKIYEMWGTYSCCSLLYTANVPSSFWITLRTNLETKRRELDISQVNQLIIDTVTII